MRTLTPALQAHVSQELTSLCTCLSVIRNDGVAIRLTDHDADVIVNGDTYHAGATFNMSALKSGSDLSVDNATIDIGVDGIFINKSDFQKELLRRAAFVYFSVNWQSPSDGTIDLKRGWIGDATIRDQSWVTLSLRGLTQALQRNILNQYSPTCRADFGDSKCGMAVSPLQLRRSGSSYKTGDWIVVPDTSSLTNVPLPNASFELSTTAGWTGSSSSVWSVTNGVLQPRDGSYILEAGDATGLTSGSIQYIEQSMSATVAGMSASQIDQGAYALTLAASISTPSDTNADAGRVRITFYDNSGLELGSKASPWEVPSFGRWTDVVAVAFVPPRTRSFKVSLEARKSSGRIFTAFDDVRVSFASSFSNRVYKSVRIPSRLVDDAVKITNYRFVNDGLVSDGGTITGWTNTHYRVVTTYGGIVPFDGAYFVVGGDDGSATAAREYTLSQTVAVVANAASPSVFEANVQRAHFAADQRSKLIVEFLDSAGAVISTLGDTYSATDTLASWEQLRVSGSLPSTTKSVRLTLKGKTGASSNLQVAFDAVTSYVFNTILPRAADAKRGFTDQRQPVFDTTLGSYTYDGDIIWRCEVAPYAFDVVNSVADRRVFTGTSIAGGDFAFFGARITWLSGANAGSVSFVRTWVQGSKTIKLYAAAGDTIAPGDRFMYSLGCNKSVSDCVSRFNNAINFRGEPYLPGTDKALTFFTTGTA